MISRDLVGPRRSQGFGIRIRPGATRSIEGTGAIPSGAVDQSEEISTDATGLRSHHTLGRGRRDRGVDRVSTSQEDPLG